LCEELLRNELGVEVTDSLREAALVGTQPGPPLSSRAAAVSQLRAGRAALVAGAVDAGILCLRQAAAVAVQCKDKTLLARALAALGGALVHAIRGHDEEGAIILNEALLIADQAGERATAVLAMRELGFIEVQAGRRGTADEWLSKAQAVAETESQQAAILGVRGMNSSDRSDYALAFEQLRESVELAARCGDRRQQAWSLSLVGRAHLLRSEHSQAAAALAETLDLVRQGTLDRLPALAAGARRRARPVRREARHGLRRFRGSVGPGLPARRSLLGRHGRPGSRPTERPARRLPRRDESGSTSP